MAPHSSTLAWKNPMDGGAWWAVVHGVTKSRTRLSDFTFTFHFHALEKEMATHSSVLAWRIPGTGEPGGLPSMGSHRVGHNWSDLAAAAAACFLCPTLPLLHSTWSCEGETLVYVTVKRNIFSFSHFKRTEMPGLRSCTSFAVKENFLGGKKIIVSHSVSHV